jgi:hypothetical protein
VALTALTGIRIAWRLPSDVGRNLTTSSVARVAAASASASKPTPIL